MTAASIKLRLSGGSGNTTPGSSLGGAISASATILTSNVDLNNLFDDISKAENGAETTDYRCVYIINTGTDPFAAAEVYLSGSTNANIEIGIEGNGGTYLFDGDGVNDEFTVPAGVSLAITSVKVGGVAQALTTDYTVASNVVTIIVPPIVGTGNVEIQCTADPIDVVAQTIGTETTAPTSAIYFSTPNSGVPLTVNSPSGVIAYNEYIPLWIKRTAVETIGLGMLTDVIGLVVRGTQ